MLQIVVKICLLVSCSAFSFLRMMVNIAKWATAKSSVATAWLKHHLVIFSEKTKSCVMYGHLIFPSSREYIRQLQLVYELC